jgi:RHS repeat-associated protein
MLRSELQGEGISYYYTRDHLGSVREMMNSSGTIVARYSYDPYGRETLVSGTNLATFQYADYYAHQPSGLYLTRAGSGGSTGRAYDPNTGRWLSRDPIRNAETYGGGLYDYVNNQPIALLDPLGLQGESTTMTVTITPDGFVAPDVIIKAKSSCCKDIKFIQYTNTRYMYFFAFGTTRLDQNGDHDPGPFYSNYPTGDGGQAMVDKPGPQGLARASSLLLGGLVQEFTTCAICRDPGPHFNEILACVHWRVINNGIATINATAGNAPPPGKTSAP